MQVCILTALWQALHGFTNILRQRLTIRTKNALMLRASLYTIFSVYTKEVSREVTVNAVSKADNESLQDLDRKWQVWNPKMREGLYRPWIQVRNDKWSTVPLFSLDRRKRQESFKKGGAVAKFTTLKLAELTEIGDSIPLIKAGRKVFCRNQHSSTIPKLFIYKKRRRRKSSYVSIKEPICSCFWPVVNKKCTSLHRPLLMKAKVWSSIKSQKQECNLQIRSIRKLKISKQLCRSANNINRKPNPTNQRKNHTNQPAGTYNAGVCLPLAQPHPAATPPVFLNLQVTLLLDKQPSPSSHLHNKEREGAQNITHTENVRH